MHTYFSNINSFSDLKTFVNARTRTHTILQFLPPGSLPKCLNTKVNGKFEEQHPFTANVTKPIFVNIVTCSHLWNLIKFSA